MSICLSAASVRAASALDDADKLPSKRNTEESVGTCPDGMEAG
jgi:hypothetical protein